VEKPPPPVPEEDPEDLENTPPPDATQRVDPELLAEFMLRPPAPPPQAREATEVIDSAPLVAQAASAAPEMARPATLADAQPLTGRGGAVWWLVLLTLSGLVTGSAGGYWLLQRLRAQAVPSAPGLTTESMAEAARQAAERAADERRRAELSAAEEQARLQPKAPAPKTEGLSGESQAAVQPAAVKSPVAEKAAMDSAHLVDARKQAIEEKRLAAEKAEAVKSVRSAMVVSASAAEASCPDGMRRVPAGAFRLGTAVEDPMRGFDEPGLTLVEVGQFCIDQFEFPNRRGGAPSVNVSWNDAKRLCEAKSKRLCTELEWEKACKGPGNARFPYGNNYDPATCNTQDEVGEDRQLAASGQFAKCRSGYGVADLSGNVAEWTATAYTSNADKTQKGGAFGRPDYASRCSARKNGSPGSRSAEVGFRCCGDLKK
jgi:formylglycine-generating enzyme required for sulfatase activity